MSRQHCLDSLHPRAPIVKIVAPCASNVVALHVSRRLKTYRRRARTNRTNNGRGAGRPLSRQRGITFNTKVCLHVEAARHKFMVVSTGCFLSSRRFRQDSTATPVVKQGEHARGHCVRYGDLSCTETQWINTRGFSVCLSGPCSQKACLVGMRRWKRRACCCMSWWRAHLWSCVRRFVAASRRGGRAVLPGYSVLGGLISLGIWVVFLRGICSGLGPSEGGIVYGLFSKEGLNVGKASVNRTHCPGLAARLTEHIRCLYRPGLKDASKPWYRLLRRRLWGVRFFPLAVSQTLAAEALAISMEAPLGNAKDAAEERRLHRKGDNAKVGPPRRRPSSWRRRKGRP